MRYLVFTSLVLLSSTPYASDLDSEKEAMLKRIEPVGKVYLQGDIVETTKLKKEDQPIVAAKASKPDGKKVYGTYCAVCHKAGLAGAPILGDTKAWGPRQKKGVDALLASSIKGLNAMPAKGTCVACSDEELKAAILFMLPQSKK